MARDLTSAMVTDLATADVCRPAFLIQMAFDSGDLNLWTGRGNLAWNALTFIGTSNGKGQALKIEGLTETTDLQARGIRLSMGGFSQQILDIVDAEPYSGRPINLWIAGFTAAGALIADPYQIFNGRIDQIQDAEDGDDFDIVLSAESIMVDFERPPGRRWTAEDQKLDSAIDTFCDFVPDLIDRPIVGKPA